MKTRKLSLEHKAQFQTLRERKERKDQVYL